MIEMPRRSVTRFFIPLIDVLTLMFCIYLLMPILRPGGAAAGAEARMTEEDRKELEQLRREKRTWADLERLRRERDELQAQLKRLRGEKAAALQQHLAVRVLQIGDEGKLYYYDPRRAKDRTREITADNAAEFVRAALQEAEGKELYLLILYPRITGGIPVYPLQAQREAYDRWFQGVAHGYDVPKG